MALMRHFFAISLCSLVVFSFTSPTQAFVRTKTTTTNGKEASLFWDSFPVRYYINKSGSSDITNLQATYDAIKASFQAWMNPGCSCFRAEYVGLTDIAAVEYLKDDPDNDKNVVFFREDSWDHNRQAVAVTSVVYSQVTGQIFGFDIEINGRDYRFSLDGASVPGIPRPIGTIDVQNTITHEAGHALGLDHSEVKEATMYASAPPGETSKRELHSDDIEGLCSIYRNETASGTCQIARSEQFLTGAGGCGCQNTEAPTQFLPLLALFLLFLLKRRI
ncbi:MAG: matrixin family metalloprotease [Myxococcales bacterium]|nr:matrixin family metalloprotease [Myxococcales bacterium]